MPKYSVRVTNPAYVIQDVEVEADSEEEAAEKAIEKAQEDDAWVIDSMDDVHMAAEEITEISDG